MSWGFVEVLPDRVTILANDALKPEEIDVPRAQQQLDRGQKEWNEAGDSEEAYAEALHVISEAEAKLATAAGEALKIPHPHSGKIEGPARRAGPSRVEAFTGSSSLDS